MELGRASHWCTGGLLQGYLLAHIKCIKLVKGLEEIILLWMLEHSLFTLSWHLVEVECWVSSSHVLMSQQALPCVCHARATGPQQQWCWNAAAERGMSGAALSAPLAQHGEVCLLAYIKVQATTLFKTCSCCTWSVYEPSASQSVAEADYVTSIWLS